MAMDRPRLYSRGLLTCLLLPLLLGRRPGARGQDLEVLQTPGPLSVSAGETLVLNCTLIGRTIPGGVRWFKGTDRNQPPIYSEKGAPPPRVTKVAPESDKDFSIHIANIQPDDAGTYYCVKYRASSGPEQEHKSGRGTVVAVIATPSPPMISAPSGRLEPKSTATFNCSSDGFSPRDITVIWLKDGAIIRALRTTVLPPGQNASYRILSTVELRLTERDVKSQLVCQLEHSTLGRPLQRTFRLGDVLQVPPKVRVESSPQAPVQLNASVTLTCSAEGFYPNDTSLVWLENDKEISPGKAGLLTQNAVGTFSLKSSLEVDATEDKNMTMFSCLVVHNRRLPVNESLVLSIAVQPEDKPLSPAGPEEKKIYIVVALVCVLLVVLVVAVIYLMKARQNKGKDPTSVRLHEAEKISGGTNQDPDPNNVNVTYADLNFDKAPKKSPQQVVEISQQSEYASIQAAQPAANDDSVTYADLDMVHLSKAPKRPAPKPEETSSEYASVQVQNK